MPRKLRVEYPHAVYHVMSRGDRREDIFLDEVDRRDFIKTLAEACQKTGWRVHVYCLMRNHYHLVLSTPNADLVAGHGLVAKQLYIRLNHRHKLFGHVFSGRYKAQVIEANGTAYLRTACDYVNLNPVRAGLLKSEERLLAYPWSSFGWYLAAPEHRPHWIRVDRLLGEHGLKQDTALARQEFEKRMEARRQEESDEEALKALRRGWCLGGEEFKKQMVEKMEGKLGEHHSGELHRESAQAKAERIVAEELSRLGWTEAELAKQGQDRPSQAGNGSAGEKRNHSFHQGLGRSSASGHIQERQYHLASLDGNNGAGQTLWKRSQSMNGTRPIYGLTPFRNFDF